jgi:hypothetical protein
MPRENWVHPWKTGDGTDALCGDGQLYRRVPMVGGGGAATLIFQVLPSQLSPSAGRNKLIEILFPERGRQEGITERNFANSHGQIACKSPFRNVAGSPRGKRG